ncbi:MAG: metal-sulfur cluster assembly factor [Bacteroidetes bacterium]|nr:metal-sulfur cluster assembly factor [Bacteroidota bacterium]
MGNLTESENIGIKIYDALKTVIDPELGVNIIDLGLVYKIEYSEDIGISVDVTLSTKGCPMADVIMNDIQTTLANKFPTEKLNIELVWEPTWNPDFMTPAGKFALGRL